MALFGNREMKQEATEGFKLSYNDGKAVQEILNRYVNEELRPRLHTNNSFHGVEDDEDFQVSKDIDYIEGLAKLFD